MLVGVFGLMTWQLWPYLGGLMSGRDGEQEHGFAQLAIWLPIACGVLLLALGAIERGAVRAGWRSSAPSPASSSRCR